MKLTNPEVRIETSTFCNSNCTICPREQRGPKKHPHFGRRNYLTMQYDKAKDLIDQSKELGATTIALFGFGEPLCDSGIAKKVHYCTKKKLGTFLTTNASLLTRDMVELLFLAGLQHIRFSVHGLNKTTYEDVHRGLTFETTFRNIFDFIYKNNNRKRGFFEKVKTSVSVIPTHYEKIEDIIKFWEPLVDWLEIWSPHGWAGKFNFRPRTEQRKKTCGRPSKGPLQINADGKMMVCCFDYSGKMIVGDTNKQSIEEIVKGDKYNRIREIHDQGLIDESDLPCKDCDQLNVGDTSLLYSNRVKSFVEGTTSSIKFNVN